MSGVGEALAITSCIFGLIQAYEAASQAVERIQRRRRARRALPPSVHLQNAVAQGKDEIQAVVTQGRERFGPEFEKGDGGYWSRRQGETMLRLNRSCPNCAHAHYNCYTASHVRRFVRST